MKKMLNRFCSFMDRYYMLVMPSWVAVALMSEFYLNNAVDVLGCPLNLDDPYLNCCLLLGGSAGAVLVLILNSIWFFGCKEESK